MSHENQSFLTSGNLSENRIPAGNLFTPRRSILEDSLRPPTARTNVVTFLHIPAGFRKTNYTMFVETIKPTNKPKRNENYILSVTENSWTFALKAVPYFAPVSTGLTYLRAKEV